MAWNGSGTYSRTNGVNTGSEVWQDDAAAATKIKADRHDVHDEDISTAINACLTQNNESKPTAHFLPNADDTYNLGSGSYQWGDTYITGLYLSGTQVTTTAANLNTVGAANVKLNTKVIEIGDWDMDADGYVTVAHGLTLSKIRGINAVIRDDADSQITDIRQSRDTATGVSGIEATAVNVVLTRQTDGLMDSTDYDSTSYNRGWITVQYTD